MLPTVHQSFQQPHGLSNSGLKYRTHAIVVFHLHCDVDVDVESLVELVWGVVGLGG